MLLNYLSVNAHQKLNQWDGISYISCIPGNT